MRPFFLIRSSATVTLCMGFLLLCCLSCSGPSREEPPHMKVHVDLTNAPQGIFHAELEIPCNAGTVTLVYPKWIPGEHAPFGPILQLVGVQFSAQGKPASWQRDVDDLYSFLCTVPEDANVLNVSLDYLSPTTVTGYGYGNSPNSTGRLSALLWSHLLLYPESESTDNVVCEPSVRLPHDWKFATALPVQSQGNDTVTFQSVSLTRLVDSPVMAGEFVRSIPLSEDKFSPVFLDLIGDSPEALDPDPAQVALCRNVIREVDTLFGVRHFEVYHFLLSLSDLLDVNGLEHHESTDIRLPEHAFRDPTIWKRRSYLIPHEYVHSWNGKYRRPQGLLSNNFQEPVQSELLWVYEGLTRYLDVILTGRSGLRSPDEVRDYIAWAAGYLDHDRPGRSWRSLHDVSVSARLLYPAPEEWSGWRRGVMDVYDEGLLLWLEVDAGLRELSKGEYSLDDFCRQFFGGEGGAPTIKTYTLDDIVKALDKIAHNDWETFFKERVNNIQLHPPLAGITKSGWELVYSETPNSSVVLREHLEHRIDATWSLGISVLDTGLVQDVIPGTPAGQAGITPGMKITRVHGAPWSPEGFRNALARSRNQGNTIDLLLTQGAREVQAHIAYREGAKYPHLRRVEGKNDLLGQIIAPKTAETGSRK